MKRANPQPLEGFGDQRESVGIEGAEALVDEQAVEIHRADGALNLVAELQGESCQDSAPGLGGTYFSSAKGRSRAHPSIVFRTPIVGGWLCGGLLCRLPGDRDDLFAITRNDRFGDATLPDSRWWDSTPSGLEIRRIRRAGNAVTFVSE